MRRILSILFLLFYSTISAQKPAESIVAVQVSGSKFQFLNKQTGVPVNTLLWDETEPFINGFSRVLLNSKFTFVNDNGIPICPAEFEGARNFSNNLSAVKKDNKWGFINETGNLVIPFTYEIVFDFNEKVTAGYENKKWWLINAKGEIIKALDISVFYGFEKGIAKISKDGRSGMMNTNGEIILNREEDKINKPNLNFQEFIPPTGINTVTVCPDNIDFEFGSFLNWKCFTGRVDSVGTTNVITVNPSPPTANRHTLYSRVNPSALDAFGLFPTNPPDGSNFAVRLGNTSVGAQAERIRYTINVPVNDSNFSIKYDYAVVFEDPGHTTWTQPRFTVRVFDSAANTYVSCASFEYISTSNLPGFARSTVDPGVIYKPWSSVFLSLRGYAGRTMYLEFTTADCVRRGHWGYAYVDVEKPCGQSIEMQYDCTAPNITTLTGPPGFQTYNWWNQNFTVLLGTGQQIVLNPGPTVNSIIYLEMIPFNTFGCTDTLAVTITGNFNADFSMSDTIGVCAPHTFTFYNQNLPSTSATWDFGDGTTGTGDTVTHTYNSLGTYIVKLHVVLPSGCIGDALKTVTILQPVGSFSFNQAYYCNNQTVRFDAVVNSSDSLIWDFGDGIILRTLQTTVFHTYGAPGIYLPSLTLKSNNGCQNTVLAPDTVKIELLSAGFIYNDAKVCGSTTVNFTDTSYSYFGIALHQWNFGDGSTGSGINVSHTYTSTGTYNVRLIITGTSGCLDTITKPIFVKVNDVPVASILGDTVRCQSAQVTFTSSVQSVDSVNVYNWTSSNGFNGSGNSFTVTFNQPGNFTIQLIVRTINGCFDTTTHPIHINPTPNVVQPANQTLCNGATTNAIAFTGAVSGTSFNWTNNNTSIGLAASGNGNIAAFTATNTTNAPVTATITVTPSASGCPGNPETFTITVNPTPNVVQPVNQIVCNGTSTNTITFSGAVSGSTFSWTNNNTSVGLAASGNGNIAAFTAINTTNAPVTATITVTPSASGCPGNPETFTITVNPTPNVVQPANQTLCNGATTNTITYTSAVSGTTFNWTNNNTSVGLAASGNGNIPAFTANNSTNAPVTATITVTPSASGCPGNPETFTITVNPTPNVVQPANQTLCNGAITNTITFSGAVSGSTFSWTNSNTSIGLPASGNGNISTFMALNFTNAPVTATITVTPSASGCAGTPETFTITVNPTPNVVQPPDQTLCSGSTTNAIIFAGTVSGTVYNWINTAASIGLPASGSGNIAPFTATSNGYSASVATITVTPTANGCAGPVKRFTISITPTPNVVQPPDQSLCNGTTTNSITFAGAMNSATYSWSNSNPTIGLSASGTGNITGFTAINNSSVPITATITVTPATSLCSGAAKTFTITVNPTPLVAAGSDVKVCLGNTVQLSATGASQYLWSPSTRLSCTNCSNPIATPIDSIRYIVKGTSSFGCIAFDTISLNVIKPFQMLVTPNDTLCIGETTILRANGANSYLWSPPQGLNRTDIAAPSATPIVTTQYRVIGYDGHNCFTDTNFVIITVGPKPKLNIGPDLTLSTGTTIQFNPVTQNGPIINWSWTPAAGLSCTNCPKPTVTVKDNTYYTLSVKNNYGCITNDTVFIFVFCKSAQVFIPNAFTPDGDGLNDILMVRGKGIFVKSFRIFNRWGELVFEKTNFNPNDIKYGWDGKVRGIPATPDVFVYTAEVICDNNVPYTYKGNTTLLK